MQQLAGADEISELFSDQAKRDAGDDHIPVCFVREAPAVVANRFVAWAVRKIVSTFSAPRDRCVVLFLCQTADSIMGQTGNLICLFHFYISRQRIAGK